MNVHYKMNKERSIWDFENAFERNKEQKKLHNETITWENHKLI